MNYKILPALVLLAGWSLPGLAQASMEDGKQVIVSQQPTQVVEREPQPSLRLYRERSTSRILARARQNLQEQAMVKPVPTPTQVVVKAPQKVAVAPQVTTPKQQDPKKTAAPGHLSNTTGKYRFGGVDLPDDYQQISLFGRAEATQQQAVSLIKGINPQPRLNCTVEEIVALYWLEGNAVGLRPDLALAQALVETGYFRYGGEVQPKQNNFCGLGTTGKGVAGASFKTPQLGVRAHLQHLLAYATVAVAAPDIVDPRYELARDIRLQRGKIDTWYGLNGTWAMGSHYAEKIMATYQNMLQQPGAAGSKPFDPSKLKRKERKRYEKLVEERGKLEEKLAKEEAKRAKLKASHKKKLAKQLAKEKILREQIAALLREEEAMKR